MKAILTSVHYVFGFGGWSFATPFAEPGVREGSADTVGELGTPEACRAEGSVRGWSGEAVASRPPIALAAD